MFPIKIIKSYAWRNITVGTVLKQEVLNFKKKKYHINFNSINFQRKPHENFS